MNRDIFRAYDIRGVVGVDFQPTDFYQIARAFADPLSTENCRLGTRCPRKFTADCGGKLLKGL